MRRPNEVEYSQTALMGTISYYIIANWYEDRLAPK